MNMLCKLGHTCGDYSDERNIEIEIILMYMKRSSYSKLDSIWKV